MSQDIPQDALTPPGTGKARYLLPSGTAGEFFIHGNTAPEQIDNLIQNLIELDRVALEAGLVSANMTAGKKTVADAVASKFKLKYDTNQIYHVVSLDILPQPGGKVKLAFFGDGFKQPRDDYAIVVNTMPIEWALNYLKPYYEFKPETMQKALTFSVDFYLEWYEQKDKLNSHGNPYKNISQVHVDEGAEPPALMEAPAPPPPPPQQEPELPPTEPDDIPF